MSRAQLVLSQDAHGPQQVDAPSLLAFISSRVHPSRGSPNQDGAAVFPSESGAVLAVVDGMGGLPNGDVAAASTLQELQKALAKVDDDGNVTQAILDGIDAANRAVRDLSGGAGATLAVVEWHGDTARTFHVGDASVLVCGQRGAIKHVTTAHSPVGYAVEAGLLEADDAMHHVDRHLVSNAVGTQDMRIEIGPPLRLAARDTVLVASDGIFDNLTEQEIVETIRKGPLAKAAASLARLATQRMLEPDGTRPSKADDATFVLARRG